MRQPTAQLATPHPLADTLPALLREDPFARSLCASFDDLLAPVVLSLDTFAAYLDPALTPDDMLGWLGQWLGLGLEGGLDPLPVRHQLQGAGTLNATRGTRRSIELALQTALGVPVTVTESGGASWSASPGGALPGQADPAVSVVVHAPPGREVDRDRVQALIGAVAPAHVRQAVAVQSG